MIHNFSWIIPNKLSGSNLPGGSIICNKFSITELNKDLQFLKEKNINVITSVIEELPDGFIENIKITGFEHLWFPIKDYSIPNDIDNFRIFINKNLEKLNENKKVNIHCRMGIGRTGLTLACIIGILNNLNSEKAINLIRKIRPLSIENKIQINFIKNFLKTYDK